MTYGYPGGKPDFNAERNRSLEIVLKGVQRVRSVTNRLKNFVADSRKTIRVSVLAMLGMSAMILFAVVAVPLLLIAGIGFVIVLSLMYLQFQASVPKKQTQRMYVVLERFDSEKLNRRE